MTQHYTRNTVEVSAWCQKCHKQTMHSVYGVKLGACLVCLERLGKEAQARPSPPAQQIGLFGGKQ